ncbi:hypothetical protein F2Q69_00005854 [Brassica cretica]|uniref:Uncharacterized protein n=1 Tax=Brassica cretica TaxID=69181 RepID=A0A8S9PB35_BRACR|nr:hypothetical protein F2Q69_00005854 [Brassica cretica]
MVETEDWPNINLVVESRAVKIDREISKNEVVEELILTRRFRSLTFWKNDVSAARRFLRNFVSAEYYFEEIGSRTGIKQDGKQARRDRSTTGKPKIGRNPNFVMQSDIWEEWWHPACVLDMQPAMWSTSFVQSTILYDCDAEALSISVRPGQSVPLMIKRKCCPELVQIHGFRSVEVLLDTPLGSLKNSPEAKEAEVLSKSRSVQSTPVKSLIRFWPSALRSTSCLSPRTLDLKDCGLSRGDPKDCGPQSVPILSPKSGLGHGVNFVTLTGSSLTRHVALPDHGVGLDGQSCSCLIVRWLVGGVTVTLLMSRRSWPEPGFVRYENVDEDGLLGVKPCLGGCKIGELWSWTSLPLSLGRINHSAWKPEAGPRPGDGDPDLEAGGRNLGPGSRNLEAAGNNMIFFIGLHEFHHGIKLLVEFGVGRRLVAMVFKLPYRDLVNALRASITVAGSMNRVEECMGQDPGILRGRILARLRIRGMRRFNKTRRTKLRILMLDSAGRACAS